MNEYVNHATHITKTQQTKHHQNIQSIQTINYITINKIYYHDLNTTPIKLKKLHPVMVIQRLLKLIRNSTKTLLKWCISTKKLKQKKQPLNITIDHIQYNHRFIINSPLIQVNKLIRSCLFLSSNCNTEI